MIRGRRSATRGSWPAWSEGKPSLGMGQAKNVKTKRLRLSLKMAY